MADYLSFVGGIVLSHTKSSDSEKELNVTNLALEKEPVIHYNHPGDTTESLATTLVQVLKAFKK